MKLYSYGGAPSPERVTLMLRYKGVQVDTETIDMRSGAHLQPEFRAINPRCTLPALVLDDGSCLSEVIAILYYLEQRYPERPLMGQSDEERAMVLNWMHRIFVEGFLAGAEALRNSSPNLSNRAMPGPDNFAQIPELAERGLQRLKLFLATLEAQLQQHDYLVGTQITQADIDAYVIVGFAGWVKVVPSAAQQALQAWHARIGDLLAVE